MKKILSYVIIPLLSATVSISLTERIVNAESAFITANDEVMRPYLSDNDPITDEETELFEFLASQYRECPKSISIPEKYHISLTRFKYLYETYMKLYLRDENPDLYYVSGLSTVTSEDGTLIEIDPTYQMTIEEINERKAMIAEEVRKIEGDITDDMSQAEKALIVHDYIAANYRYDERVMYGEQPDDVNNRLDTMIEHKVGVCQGYSYLFKYVMNDLGIECEIAPSTECNHMWNRIKIDGEWYNIDITYDDPVYDASMNIVHQYFLLSDDEIKSLDSEEHRVWDPYKWNGKPVEISDSTRYSDLRLHDIDGRTVYKNGSFWCMDNDQNICVFDINQNKFEIKYAIEPKFIWFANEEKNSIYEYPSSALAPFNGRVYLNSRNAVYDYDIHNNMLNKIYDYDGEKNASDTYFFGLTTADNNLYAEYKDEPNGAVNSFIRVIPLDTREGKNWSVSYGADTDGIFTLTLTDKADTRPEGAVILAMYDRNGTLTGAQSASSSGDGIYTVTAVHDMYQKAQGFKIFSWILSDNMQPLRDSEKFEF